MTNMLGQLPGRGLAALAHACHLCLRVQESHALLLHLQHHLLRPHLPFGVQQTQASHAVLYGHHPVFPVQHERGQVLQVSHNHHLICGLLLGDNGALRSVTQATHLDVILRRVRKRVDAGFGPRFPPF